MLFKLAEDLYLGNSLIKSGSVLRIALTLKEWVESRKNTSFDKEFTKVDQGYELLKNVVKQRKDKKIKDTELKTELGRVKELMVDAFYDKFVLVLEDWGGNRSHPIVKQVQEAYKELVESFELISEGLTAETVKGDVDEFFDDLETETEAIEVLFDSITDKIEKADTVSAK